MKLSQMKEGEYLYSNVTQILYTRKNGVVMKFPMYSSPPPQREWTKSAYSLDSNHFVKPSKQIMDNLREYTRSKG